MSHVGKNTKDHYMTDQTVSFETSKLAKEKGFDLIQRYGNEASLYDKHVKENHVYYANYGFMYSGLNEGYISAPTQSLLQKWLREKHRVHIAVMPWSSTTWWYQVEDIEIYDSSDGALFSTIRQCIKHYLSISNDVYNTYEEALEVGLQEALKLINT